MEFSPRTADTKRLRKRGAIMKIYNTLTRKKEEFQPLEEAQGKDVCLRTDRIQPDSYRKCKTDDLL